jgi:hypothetical protein
MYALQGKENVNGKQSKENDLLWMILTDTEKEEGFMAMTTPESVPFSYYSGDGLGRRLENGFVGGVPRTLSGTTVVYSGMCRTMESEPHPNFEIFWGEGRFNAHIRFELAAYTYR